MKFASAQNNFSNGELSPRLEGRNDLKEYFNGVATLENFIPSREGGAFRRPGTLFVKKNMTEGGLYEFVINRQESYLIHIEATTATNLRFTTYKQSFSGGSPLLTFGTVQNFTLDASQLEIDFNKFNFAQINNIMFLTHVSGKLPPYVIARVDTNSFSIVTYEDYVISQNFNKVLSSVYPKYNADVTKTVASSGGATPTLTASSGFFVAGMVGAKFKMKDAAASETVFTITGYTSPTIITASLEVGTAAAIGATSDWTLESWNKVYGYPQSVSFYQERLAFGGTFFEPNVIWLSVSGNLAIILNRKLLQDVSVDNSGMGYYGTIIESDSFQLTMSTSKTNSIQWLQSNRRLQIGTTSAEHVVSTVDGTLSSEKSIQAALTFYGSNNAAAISVQNSTLFITTDGKSVRDITYSEENGSNVSQLLSTAAEHLVYHNVDELVDSMAGVEITKMVYQASRSCIWVLLSTGNLIGFTLENSTNTLAWHKHIVAGVDTKILSLAVMPDDLGDFDTVYMLVERTIDGASEIYVEAIGNDFRLNSMYGHINNEGRNHPVYMDSTYAPLVSGTPGEFLMLTLEGETVSVLVKGVYVGDQVVTGGIVTVADLTATDGDVLVGLPFTSIIKSMKLQEGSRIGDAQILFKRIDTVLLTLLNSKTYKVGSRSDNTETRVLKDITNINLFTGEDRVSVESSPGEEQRFYIESTGPFPLNILSVGIRGETQE